MATKKTTQRKPPTKRATVDIESLKRTLKEYEIGKIGKIRFAASYRRLRSIVEYRIKSLEEKGLSSNALDELYFYLRQSGQGTHVGAFTKVKDAVQTYRKMIRFLTSPFSSVSTYKEAAKFYEDFVKGAQRKGANIHMPTSEEFTKFLASGDFARLVHAIGNSPEAQRDIEALLSEGITYEDMADEIDKFIRGSTGYDEMLDNARENMRARLVTEPDGTRKWEKK